MNASEQNSHLSPPIGFDSPGGYTDLIWITDCE